MRISKHAHQQACASAGMRISKHAHQQVCASASMSISEHAHQRACQRSLQRRCPRRSASATLTRPTQRMHSPSRGVPSPTKVYLSPGRGTARGHPSANVLLVMGWSLSRHRSRHFSQPVCESDRCNTYCARWFDDASGGAFSSSVHFSFNLSIFGGFPFGSLFQQKILA